MSSIFENLLREITADWVIQAAPGQTPHHMTPKEIHVLAEGIKDYFGAELGQVSDALLPWFVKPHSSTPVTRISPAILQEVSNKVLVRLANEESVPFAWETVTPRDLSPPDLPILAQLVKEEPVLTVVGPYALDGDLFYFARRHMQSGR